MLSQVCVFVCPQGKVVGNIECMVGYSPGKSQVEYPRLPPRTSDLGTPCSDIWWWSLKPYGFQEERILLECFLVLLCASLLCYYRVLSRGIPLVPCPFWGGSRGRVSMGVGVSGWERGLWYLEVGYTPSLPGYFRVGTHPAPTFSRK